VGDGVTSPQLIYSTDPSYSDQQRREIQGVSVVVDEQGNPQRVAVVRPLGHGFLERLYALLKAALRALKDLGFDSWSCCWELVPRVARAPHLPSRATVGSWSGWL
jgi:hypothetical protein